MFLRKFAIILFLLNSLISYSQSPFFKKVSKNQLIGARAKFSFIDLKHKKNSNDYKIKFNSWLFSENYTKYKPTCVFAPTIYLYPYDPMCFGTSNGYSYSFLFGRFMQTKINFFQQ